MNLSTTLRDSGMAIADRNTPEAWKEQVDYIIRALSLSGQVFTAEDVRKWAGEPPRPNAFGSRFMKAIKRGWIQRIGYTNATRPDAHARALAQYRGAV